MHNMWLMLPITATTISTGGFLFSGILLWIIQTDSLRNWSCLFGCCSHIVAVWRKRLGYVRSGSMEKTVARQVGLTKKLLALSIYFLTGSDCIICTKCTQWKKLIGLWRDTIFENGGCDSRALLNHTCPEK